MVVAANALSNSTRSQSHLNRVARCHACSGQPAFSEKSEVLRAGWSPSKSSLNDATFNHADLKTQFAMIAGLQRSRGNGFVQRLVAGARQTELGSRVTVSRLIQRDEDEFEESGDSIFESEPETETESSEGIADMVSDGIGEAVDGASGLIDDVATGAEGLADGAIETVSELFDGETGKSEEENAENGGADVDVASELVLNNSPGGQCQPFATRAEAINSRSTLETILPPLLTAFVGGAVAPLWKQYLSGGSDPQELTDLAIVGPFASSGTTVKAGSDAADAVKERMNAFRDRQLPDGTHRIEQDQVIFSARRKQIEDAMDYDVPGTVPGNIAGGIGTDQQSNRVGAKPSPFNDSRRLGGTIDISTLPDGRRTVLVNPFFTVFDTIDLCPGNTGSPFEALFTVPMSRCEASGVSGDVPFRVAFGGKEELRVTEAPTKPPASPELDPPLPPGTG